jgi:hypothetical protein
MNLQISHNPKDETIEAKVRWFRSLSLSERMNIFCSFTDLALNINPQLPDKKHVEQTEGRIQIITAA